MQWEFLLVIARASYRSLRRGGGEGEVKESDIW